jgi:hypothetical protein
MNKQIQQLAERAGMRYPVMGEVTYAEFSYEEFARLIIQDCANWIEDATFVDSCGHKDHIGDAYFWSSQLRKHFGVE